MLQKVAKKVVCFGELFFFFLRSNENEPPEDTPYSRYLSDQGNSVSIPNTQPQEEHDISDNVSEALTPVPHNVMFHLNNNLKSLNTIPEAPFTTLIDSEDSSVRVTVIE